MLPRAAYLDEPRVRRAGRERLNRLFEHQQGRLQREAVLRASHHPKSLHTRVQNTNSRVHTHARLLAQSHTKPKHAQPLATYVCYESLHAAARARQLVCLVQLRYCYGDVARCHVKGHRIAAHRVLPAAAATMTHDPSATRARRNHTKLCASSIITIALSHTSARPAYSGVRAHATRAIDAHQPRRAAVSTT